MTTKLKKSTYNAILLFFLSIVSNLVIDFQAHGFPPSINVLYASVLFALFAFLTTLSTHTYKERKNKGNRRVLSQTVEQVAKQIDVPKVDKAMSLIDLPNLYTTFNSESPELCAMKEKDDWIPGTVI